MARRTKLLVVGHSASRTGAPKVLLALLRWFAGNAPELDVTLVLGEGGALLDDFRGCASSVRVVDGPAWRFRAAIVSEAFERMHLAFVARGARRLLLRLGQVSTRGFDLVYLNTVASLPLVSHQTGNCPVLLHVHELHFGVEVNLPGDARGMIRLADRYLADATSVHSMLTDEYAIDERLIGDVTAWLPDSEAARDTPSREAARAVLGLEANDPVVVGVGGLDWRKGFDVFLSTAVRVSRLLPETEVKWIWVGINDDSVERHRGEVAIARAGLADKVLLVPEQADPLPYYAACSLLLMPTREDAFGLIALEAALARRAVVCQSAIACGAADFVSQGAGIVAPHLDVDAMAQAVVRLIRDPALAAEMGECGRQLVIDRHLVSTVAPTVYAALLRTLGGDSAVSA